MCVCVCVFVYFIISTIYNLNMLLWPELYGEIPAVW